MATVVLQYAGTAVGTLLGGPIGGAIGGTIGAVAGNIIDQKIFGPGTQRREGPRLNDLRVMASEEGSAIPALWGRMRIAGQVIWATNLLETSNTTTQKSGGKGGPKVKTTTYSYFANFAVGLCEGEIDGIGRVWADGKLIDLKSFTTRLYTGTETQNPDSLITAIEGAGAAPAYRGVAYIVFDRLPLESFGNRIPQLSFEIFRRGSSAADAVRAVNIIPGSTEFGYDTAIVTRTMGVGATASENANLSAARSDWSLSLDQLQTTCRNVQWASLVVAWFGDDLRCGTCTVRPKVDSATKVTNGATWSVSGLPRALALATSLSSGLPAYGGTPSDATVVRAILDMHTRGLSVMFNPFLLMDIAQGNALPDPYGGTTQAAYPWRGRITASVAPGLAGTPDKTAAAATQIASFVGACLPSQFTVSGTTVTYSGPNEWSYRRQILHYAKLCAAAGGVEAFILGSEMRGLTTLRGAANAYPFVVALQQLAAEVKAILPAAKISYGADWSEYFGHQPQDGSNDVFFHLDPLWASSSVDFIGIDNYMPLTDWRDGTTHLDALAGATSIYDLNYLKSRIAGGEAYDWFYASQSTRDSQTRTTITDGSYGKPWVFRPKDLVNWWQNQHFNRPAGVQSATATAWVPQSKPFWFTESGCPAVDKGTNAPNAFIDAKSAESVLPPYSGGQQDDVIQHRYLKAMQDYWSVNGATNPVSTVYSAPMVAANRIFTWAWDARPFPAFPARTDLWSDGGNWPRGHWLNGRLGAVDLGKLIADVAQRYGFTGVDVSAVAGLVDGFLLDRPMSGRDALEDLLKIFAIDAVESEGILKFRPRKTFSSATYALTNLVDESAVKALITETRAQETDLPRAVRIGYVESAIDYRTAAVLQQRLTTASTREITLQLPAAVTQALAQSRADVALEEAWAARTTAQFALAPSQLALDPGDAVTVNGKLYRISLIDDGEARKVTALIHDPTLYDPPPAVTRGSIVQGPPVYGVADALLMDLAMVHPLQAQGLWIAAHQTPWPGQLALLKQTSAASLAFNRFVTSQATMGTTLNVLPAGISGRIDYTRTLDVRMDYGALASISKDELLGGGNVIAVGSAVTGYELVQFLNATLIAADTYRLSGLLRSQAGSQAEMQVSAPAGSRLVLLNAAVLPIGGTLTENALATTWKIGPASLDAASPSYSVITTAAALKALRPLAPVNPKLRRLASGLQLSWIRQTRVNGDSWELPEVPLGEDVESYKLDILSGAVLKRTVTLATPTYTYLDADMITDFGAVQSALTFRIAQISATFGAGTTLERTLNA
jgi:GTA TIM-barrel-like domain/Putative phage tail protein